MGWSLSIDQIYNGKQNKFKMTRPFQWTSTKIYLNPSVVWTSGQTFRPFVPCHMFYPILNEIKEKRITIMYMSTGKQNSPPRRHVEIAERFWRILSIRQFSKFQFLRHYRSRERLDYQRSTWHSWSFSKFRLCGNEMTVGRQGRNWTRKLFQVPSKKKKKLNWGNRRGHVKRTEDEKRERSH
jgi:hypothetical protein